MNLDTLIAELEARYKAIPEPFSPRRIEIWAAAENLKTLKADASAVLAKLDPKRLKYPLGF